VKKAKIVHLTSAHPPYDIRVFHKECKTLAAGDYEVVLVVPYEMNTVTDGVRIRCVRPPDSRRQRMLRVVWQVLRTALEEQADLYHFHDPELIPAAIILKLCGRRVVYDVHENVPEDILDKPYIALPLRKPLAWSVGLVEKFSARVFDAVVCATPAIARHFHEPVLVQNFPLGVDSEPTESEEYCDRPLVAAYTGGITVIRGIREMVQAMHLLPNELDARLVVAAKFSPPQLEEQVSQLPGWDRVDYVGWKSLHAVAQILASARMGLVLYHPLANHTEAQPHKLFEYMSAGLPIVASDFPLWRRIIEGSRCGIVVDPMDSKAIASAITWLFEHPQEAKAMGERGRQAADSLYNWKHEAEALLKLYRNLLSSAKTPRMDS